ncbi:wall-associated receptor kinase 2 [Rosa sericea]
MALHGRPLIVQLISLVMVAIEAASDQALPPQALPGCPGRCGNLTIPYPFGIGRGCYLRARFNITCNESAQPATALWGDGRSVTATNIFLAEAELQILSDIAHDCYNKQGNQTQHSSSWLGLAPPFTISSTRNKFTAVGCDTIAIFRGSRPYPNEGGYIRQCTSMCYNLDSAVTNSCSAGVVLGCCQTVIPSGLKNGSVTLSSFSQHKDVWNFNPCSYAFIVEEGKFTFNPKTIFQELNNTEKLPMILNWEIQDGPCAKAQKRSDYACKANSKCVNRTINIQTEPSGYYCQCLPGFEGNPYLPDGCRAQNYLTSLWSDIDECMAPINPCNHGTCENLLGDYTCSCNKGFRNQDKKTCIQNNPTSKNKSLKISLGRRIVKLKEKYFKENGGIILQEKLASHGGRVDTTKIFTAKELEKATNNYHESRVIGEGGYGTVYKGILLDNIVVAIKKSKVGSRAQSDQFVNELIFLSQINHRHVVRLLGCCFETQVPLLVYEYITNGTLFEHLFNNKKGKRSSLSWELRLKIASETAGALAYLHSSTSTPIIHRDVKTTNILLDENYTAKVSDFGASRFIPLDQSEVATLVQGTMGYLDPEYLQSNTLTEKSDVYSFGVVLAELLTSKVAVSFARPESERSLAYLFVSSIEKQCLIQILDADMVNEGNVEMVEQVANLAKICLRVKGEERPMMKEVAMELEGMRITAKHPWKNADFYPEETEYLLESPNSKSYIEGKGEVSSSGSVSRYASVQNEMLKSYDDGR